LPPDPELLNRETTTVVPNTVQTLFAYDGNGDLIYMGYAQRDTATSDEEGWLIKKFTYSGSDVISIQTSEIGAWDDRTDLDYK